MNVTEFLLSEMNREVERSRRALQEVPTGKYDWKPHDKSHDLWLSHTDGGDDSDVDHHADQGRRIRCRTGSWLANEQEPKETSEALVKALDEAASAARSAFAATR